MYTNYRSDKMQVSNLAINAHNNDATPCDIRPEHEKKEEKFNKTFAKKNFLWYSIRKYFIYIKFGK